MLPNFEMNEQMKMDKHIPEQLAKVKADLSQRKHWVKPATERDRQAHDGFVSFARLDPETGFLMRSERRKGSVKGTAFMQQAYEGV